MDSIAIDEATENTSLLGVNRKGASKGSSPSSTNSDGDSEVTRKTPKVDVDTDTDVEPPSPGRSTAATPVMRVDPDPIEQPPPVPPEPVPPERNIVECSCCLQCTKYIQKHSELFYSIISLIMHHIYTILVAQSRCACIVILYLLPILK